jgi:hypothetical protein
VVRATIDEGSHRITAAFPEGTDLTNLVASFEYNGSSVYVGEVKQISGITINDFSKDVVYKVMAHNNTTIEYTVAVNILEDEE